MRNTTVKSVFRCLYFLRSYKHSHIPCLLLHKVLNVGHLLCQASVQSILIRVMNNWVDRLQRYLAPKGAHIEHLM